MGQPRAACHIYFLYFQFSFFIQLSIVVNIIFFFFHCRRGLDLDGLATGSRFRCFVGSLGSGAARLIWRGAWRWGDMGPSFLCVTQNGLASAIAATPAYID